MAQPQKIKLSILVYFSAASFLMVIVAQASGKTNAVITLLMISTLFLGAYEGFLLSREDRLDWKTAIVGFAVIGAGMFWVFPRFVVVFSYVVLVTFTMFFILRFGRLMKRKAALLEHEIEQQKRVRSVWKVAFLGTQNLWSEISPPRRWPLAFAYLVTVLTPMTVVWIVATLPVQVQNQLPKYVSPTIGLSVSVVIMSTIFLVGLISAEVKERRFVEVELRAAHDMQMGLMPKEDPSLKGFEISGVCVPANEVGGDFYDYVWLDEKKALLGIAIADVSGKAMRAAMTAVLTSGMLYSEAEKSKSPREILARINKPLYLRSDKRVFTALSFAVLDRKTKKLTYSSAGQSNPLLVRNGSVNYLKTDGVRLPLGLKEGLQYSESKVKLKKGDTVVFYTDGIPEAMNTQKEMYGFERLEPHLKELGNAGAQEMRDGILADVSAFTGNAPQHDDMTVVVVKVKG